MAGKPRVRGEQAQKQNDVFDVVQYAKRELIEKQKADLPKFIKKRKRQFIKALEEYDIIQVPKYILAESGEKVFVQNKTLSMYDIEELCFAPLIKFTNGMTVDYTPDEMATMFDYFKICIKEMNKVELVPPTKEMFCSLCGFSTKRFTQFKAQSSEMAEVMAQIEDFIANFLNMSGLTRKTDAVTGIFIQKSSLGRKEDDGPQQVTNNNTLVLSDKEFEDLLSRFPKK